MHLAPPRSIQTTTTTSSSTSTSNTVPTNRHKKHRPTVVKKNKGTVAKKHRHCPKKHRSGTTVWKYTGYCCNLHQFQLKQLSKFSRIQAICALCHKASEALSSSRLRRGPAPSSGSLPAPKFERIKSNLRPGPSNACLGLGDLCEPAGLGIVGCDMMTADVSRLCW